MSDDREIRMLGSGLWAIFRRQQPGSMMATPLGFVAPTAEEEARWQAAFSRDAGTEHPEGWFTQGSGSYRNETDEAAVLKRWENNASTVESPRTDDLGRLQAECRAEAERLRSDETPSSWAIARAWQIIDEHLPAGSWDEHECQKPLVGAIAKAIDEGQTGVLTNVAEWEPGDEQEDS